MAEYKVNTQDVFERAKKTVESLQANIQTLEIQREEVHVGLWPVRSPLPFTLPLHSPPTHTHTRCQDVKTVQHMEQVNLRKYRVTSVEDALAVLEEAGEAMVWQLCVAECPCSPLCSLLCADNGLQQPVSWLGFS